MTANWLITVVWFIAGICATGSFWYFLGAKSAPGAIMSGIGAVLAGAVAVVLMIRNEKQWLHSIEARLLFYIWCYPLSGRQEASWAVKESKALLGDVGAARDQPGLGVAIVTTELAFHAFGPTAADRVGVCIQWAVGQAEHQPPYRIEVKERETIDSAKLPARTDFRHTLAFAVILARARKLPQYWLSHLQLTLERQDTDDGGWPADSVATVSPVFTAFYAIELLHVASSNPDVPSEMLDQIPMARLKGINWLIQHRGPDGLWTSGALSDFRWDRAFTSAWVLHRLACTSELQVDQWNQCLDNATFEIIKQALDPGTWRESTEEQRYRVESRIAAAASRMRQVFALSAQSGGVADAYLGSWKTRARHWAARLPQKQWDVGTAAFLLNSLVTVAELPSLAEAVLKAESRSRLPRAAFFDEHN
jgi:hypothetical protein